MRADQLVAFLLEDGTVQEGWKDWTAAGLLAAAPFTGSADPRAPAKTAPKPKPAVTQVAQRPAQSSLDKFLKALHQVEAGGRMNPPDGDMGRAVGPFQIHKNYWRDALKADPKLGGTYQDCRKYDYAKKVVAAYLKAYGKQALASNDFKTLAKIHNGGPDGVDNPRTEPYWQRVKSFL